ncbi:uncharacterized protein BJ212DRAFT_1311944 [Suillus subaureus]|uniref:Uncharacterized protein n=1 Tax=Suillus subaureus TaxID=48587 RepID=A0A9P7EP35_9AGAM|nr:uncharacterized protein BJ212DRAFT_1311944 [Suillus subaureus]KAG1827392.1 hypothetical protein BJ212DRAFT_1311944 [Suillus subaureus]
MSASSPMLTRYVLIRITSCHVSFVIWTLYFQDWVLRTYSDPEIGGRAHVSVIILQLLGILFGLPSRLGRNMTIWTTIFLLMRSGRLDTP